MAEGARTLGAYSLSRKIGAGGMGEVYLARDPRLERDVALKVLPDALRSDPERRQRFLREARAVAKLAHPNITAIHEIGEAEGRDYIAFEYVEGQTLHDLVRARPLSLGELLDLALPLADAIGYAHERGVIHRDLKPANVMVSSRGHPKLLDFGLAKILEGSEDAPEGSSTALTVEGAIFGTPQGMSPEQALGRPIDARSDIFSFGSLLYEMAAGRRAFSGSTPLEILHAVVHGEPRDLASARPDLPPSFAAVVAKALRKDPADRYPRMGDLAADLRRIRAGSAASRRGLWIAGTAAAIVLAALAAFSKLGGGSHAPPAGPEDLASAPVGVLGFENLGDPADPLHWNRMLMGLVTTNLSESGGLQVVSTPRILSALRDVAGADARFDTALAGRVAERAGVRTMLVGQILPRGQALTLSVELVDVEAGSAIRSWTHQAASEAELFDLAKALGDGVRASLGRATATAGESVDLARALTSSTEAYRQFAAGELALHEFRFEDAAERFEHALRIDPSFAHASYRLGMSNSWINRDERSIAAFRAGLEHVDRLPARWQAIYRAYLANDLNDYDEAYRELIALGDSASDLADFHNLLGEVYTHGSRYFDPLRARACFERTLEVDPTFKVVLYHLMEDYLLAGDEAAAEKLVQRYRELDPGDPAAAGAQVALHLARGEAAEAVKVTEAAGHERTSRFSFATSSYLLAGQLERAEKASEAAMRRLPGQVNREAALDRALARVAGGRLQVVRDGLAEDVALLNDDPGENHVWTTAAFAMVEWTIGPPGVVFEDLAVAVRMDPYSCIGAFWLGFLLCETGRIDEAEQALATLDRNAAGMVSPLPRFWRPLLAGVIAQARGDLASARRELGRAEAEPVEYRDRGLAAMLRARLETAAGNGEAAIAAWRELLEPPYLRYTSFGGRNLPWRPIQILGHYELAKLEEQRGGTDAAREHYRRFLGYWGAADSTLPSIEDARSRLAKLESR